MKKVRFFLIAALICCACTVIAQQGKDGAKTISVNNTVVNESTYLLKDVAAGFSELLVTDNSLNTNNRFPAPLAQGDLLLIIQLQGVVITGNVNDSTWGTITAYNSCGRYEFAEVSSVSSNMFIELSCPLKNTYASGSKVEVVRVPRYTTLTVNANDTLTCDLWDGHAGGIVVIEAQTGTTINAGGAISATGKGFRGGAFTNLSGSTHLTLFYAFTGASGAQKGEGIVGYQNDYNAYGGPYCRGAGANGGGGGTGNAAGGGGANAGDINAYTGNGNPDISNTSWIAAWNLEYNGFANSTSSGGGRGGRTASAGDQNALVVPPNSPSWGYDWGANVGGKGGRPLDYSDGRIFMGGGGGAGGANNGVAGAGGNGGGIIFITTPGAVSGNGSLVASGQNGYNATLNGSTGTGAQDGPGGAGGGGTIIVNAAGGVSGVQLIADGGNGGNQIATISEAEGGGGGGGGGYIAISSGAPALRQATGGANGITHSPSLTEFTPGGATKGGDGMPNETITNVTVPANLSAGTDASICNGQSVTLQGSGGDPSTYNWNPATGLSNATAANPVANPTITTHYILTSAAGACSQGGADTVVITVSPAIVLTPIGDTAICDGESVALNPSGLSSIAYIWSPATGLSCSVCANPLATPPSSTTYQVIALNAGCADTATVAVNLGGKAHAGFITAVRDTLCAGTAGRLTLQGNSGNNIQWQSSLSLTGFTDNGIIDTTDYRTQPLLQSTYYRVIVGSGSCVDTSAPIRLFIPPALTALFTVTKNGTTVNFMDASDGNIISYDWDFGDGTGGSGLNPTHKYAKDTLYYVCLSIYDGSNCSYTFCRTVDLGTGIATLAAQAGWLIYPVPFSNELVIDGGALNADVQFVQLYDVPGRTVLLKDINNHSTNPVNLNVSALPAGTYLLKIKTNEREYLQKVVKG